MSTKKVLIVYFSRTGHTRDVAKQLARQLDCDCVEIFASNPYKPGLWGFQRGLLHTFFKIMPEIQFTQLNLSKFDLIILGTPIWAGSLSAPIRTFLNDYRTKIKEIALFSTQGGSSGRERLNQQIKHLYGREPIAYMALNERDTGMENMKKYINRFLEDLKISPTKSSHKNEKMEKSEPHPS